MTTNKRGAAKKCAVSARRIWIGFSSDGAEIVATYTSRAEVAAFREAQETGREIVIGPWVREPKRKR